MKRVLSKLDKLLEFWISSLFLATKTKRGRPDSWDGAIILVALVPANIYGLMIAAVAYLFFDLNVFDRGVFAYWASCMLAAGLGLSVVLSEVYSYHGSEAIRESGSRKAGCIFLGSILGALVGFIVTGYVIVRMK